jgi:hypothetical protein
MSAHNEQLSKDDQLYKSARLLSKTAGGHQ